MFSYRPSPRAWAAVAVLLAWVGSLGWLGARSLTRTDSAAMTAQAALRLSPAAAWFGLYSGDLLVGQAGITLDTLSPGYQVLETFAFETPQNTTIARMTRLTTTTVTASLAVSEIRSRSVRFGRSVTWLGTMPAGEFRLSPVGQPDRGESVTVTSPPTSRAFFPYRLALSGGLVRDRQRSMPAVLGWPASVMPLDLTVGGDSVMIFADSSEVDPATGSLRVAHRDTVTAHAVLVRGDGASERWWVDQRGQVVGIETAFGLAWVRTDFDMVAEGLREAGAGRLELLRSHYPGMAVLARPDTVTRSQRFLLSRRDGRPIDTLLLAGLDGGRQVIVGDTLIVQGSRGSGRGDRHRLNLPADPLGAPGDLRLQALVERAQAGLSDEPSELVKGLLREIRGRVRLDTAGSAPIDARLALSTGRAQAEGMARLFVAAANLAGLAARLAIGVLPVGEGYRVHVWADVLVNGYWTAVDPVFGREGASTGLIRLASSGSGDPWQMLPRVVQLRVTPLTIGAETP